jgi:hypothetical protein
VVDGWTRLVSAEICSAVLEGSGDIRVEDELGCEGRHAAQCGDKSDGTGQDSSQESRGYVFRSELRARRARGDVERAASVTD